MQKKNEVLILRQTAKNSSIGYINVRLMKTRGKPPNLQQFCKSFFWFGFPPRCYMGRFTVGFFFVLDYTLYGMNLKKWHLIIFLLSSRGTFIYYATLNHLNVRVFMPKNYIKTTFFKCSIRSTPSL